MKFFQFVLIALLMIGCANNRQNVDESRHTQPRTQTKVVETKVVTESLLNVSCTAPNEAVLGQSYLTEVSVSSVADTSGVVIATKLPAGSTYLRSEPSGAVQGDSVTWQLGALSKGKSQKVKLWLKAGKQGRNGLCFTAVALPTYCVATNIGKPALNITKKGPATANLNENVTYQVVVKNTGTAVAKNVTVTDNVPNGLVHASGKRALSFPVGDLAPGASKTIAVTMKATKRGKVCNVAVAKSDSTPTVQAQACTQIMKKNLQLTVNCPQRKFVNERGNTQITISNPGDVTLTGTVLTAVLPSQVSLVSADAAPQKNGNTLIWKVGNLGANKSKTYKLTLLGKVEGEHCVKVTITTAEGLTKTSTCCTKWIGQPKLQITKTGPATAKLGSNFSYTVTVKSVGTGVAKNVVVTDNLPSQLSHPKGRQVRFPLGDMAPGTTKSVTVPVTAKSLGRPCNVAIATSTNAEKVSAQACTKIQQQSASASLTCPNEAYIGKRINSVVSVKNTGDIALTNVTITATWDADLRVAKAEGNPSLQGSRAVWKISSLKPGSTARYAMTNISLKPGRRCINITMTCSEGVTEKASCCTEWKGLPALLIEVIDTNDPLLVGDETDYVIEVTNQGSAPDYQIKIDAKFPAEISPLSASGDTRGTVGSKNVSFAAYPVLNPQQKIRWKIRAKGVKLGDSRLKVEMNSKLLKKRKGAVTEEESTQVY